jgi:hypothetical protein
MKHRAMDSDSDHAIAAGMAGGADYQTLVVDSAISHCEKLRRVLELEGWIREALNNPLLTRASRRWQAEREQLITELELSH